MKHDEYVQRKKDGTLKRYYYIGPNGKESGSSLDNKPILIGWTQITEEQHTQHLRDIKKNRNHNFFKSDASISEEDKE